MRIPIRILTIALVVGSLACLSCGTVLAQQSGGNSSEEDYYLITGSYAPADSPGIRIFRFDPKHLSAKQVSATSGIENPSYLALSPDDRILYAVSETHGPKGGGIFSYAFNPTQPALHYLSRQLSGGADPCYVCVDQTGSWVLVCNYSSGSLSVFPAGKDGRLSAAVQTIQHQGSSVNKARQAGPHVHSAVIAPNNIDVFVADLGMDKIMSYRLNDHTGRLTPSVPPFIKAEAGTGPRHLLFHPNGKFVYLIQEMSGKISAYAYGHGTLTLLQTVSTVPAGYQGRISGSALHFSPDARFLYASDRDDLNCILIYRVDSTTGRMSYVGKQDAGGATPRDFTISPDGKYLLVGHQGREGITIFRRDPATGLLTATRQVIPASHVVCLKMIGAPQQP